MLDEPAVPQETGFSIVELLVTVVIVSILATAIVPIVEISSRRTKEAELRRALREVRDGLDAYFQAVQEGRVEAQLGASGYPRSLSELVEGVTDLRSPSREKIYFLRRIPKDPFLNTDSIEQPSWGLRSYSSSSDDPKPGADVFDIYSLSKGAGLDGVPYNQW